MPLLCLLRGHAYCAISRGIHIEVGTSDERQVDIVKCGRCGRLSLSTGDYPSRRMPSEPPPDRAHNLTNLVSNGVISRDEMTRDLRRSEGLVSAGRVMILESGRRAPTHAASRASPPARDKASDSSDFVTPFVIGAVVGSAFSSGESQASESFSGHGGHSGGGGSSGSWDSGSSSSGSDSGGGSSGGSDL